MKAVQTNDFGIIIKDLFPKDKQLMDYYHVYSGKGEDICVEKTIHDISKFDKSFKFYKVILKNKLIGFFGIEYNNNLSTLFLLPEYRKRDYVKNYWNLIKNHLQKPFYSALYSKNKPCIDFFIKNGAKIITKGIHDNNEFLVFKFEE